MHLLKLDDNGKPVLTRFLAGNIPSYAILSHTWEADNQEVTYKDLTDGVGVNKLGYRKIQFCGEQTQIDGLQYFWVDSCCIDKSSSAELQEAINSMFRWYRNAAKCYVYLSDVSTGKHSRSSEVLWESAFGQSRWFTRGWTLQELLAPSSVEFFSREGKRLGDKKSLEAQIHYITGIAVQALQGNSLSGFSVDKRMSWAANRKTTIDEDEAYCLLGIFDIYLPLIYGEGKENAFRRLRKEIRGFGDDSLGLLPYAAEAPFNSNRRQHDPTCLPDTRVDLLRDLYNWADGQDGRCIFWLSGLAGTGKSTIARTVARRYLEQKRLGASFFFSRGGGDVGHADKFVTSIALQLASSIPSLDQHICDALTERRDIASQSLRDQWQQLVLRPLSKLSANGYQSSYVLVVDALDECNNDNNIRIILDLLAETRSLTIVRLRVFLTSRPEVPIRYGFRQLPNAEHQDFVLHNISPSIVDHDISVFFEYNLNLIGQEYALDAYWPGEEIIRQLIQIAGGLFIWAATACRFIKEGKRFAARRLDTILRGSSSAPTAPEKHLNEIYTTVLKQSVAPEYTDEEKEEAYCMLRTTLGSIVTLLSPLSASSLSRLLGIRKEVFDQTLNDLHSVLDVPKDQSQLLRLHHPSFRDYLLSRDRCQDPDFWVDEKQAHQILADRCIRLMSASLKQDICDTNAPGILVAEVERSQIERSLPPEVQYACLYWIEHLQRSSSQLCDNGQVHCFLQEHLLHWLEALGWMGKVPEGVHAIASLRSFVFSSNCRRLSTFLHDTKRFVLYNRPAIEQAPLQTYCSALVFAPTTSIIRKQFERCIPGWIRKLPRVEEKWNAVLQTLEGHSDSVTAVAFSPDGRTLASASDDDTVKLWDAGSGAVLQTLEGHSGPATTVAFSPDGRTLALASGDSTVKLWDVGSGAVLQTLEGHSEYVSAVAFSPDGRTLASASGDSTVKLWDVRSGAVLQTLEGHSKYVPTLVFSPDGKTLASSLGDRTVKLWDTGSGDVLQTLEGHSKYVPTLVFSPDGKTLASASWDSTVKLWDVRSGAVLQMLEGHSESVGAVVFSPDGKTLASASDDSTVKLWDAVSGAVLQTLEGHSGPATAVAFSPDGRTLASASRDSTVKLWDTGSGAVLQTLEGHSGSILAVTFSPDGKTLASASRDSTVKLWDTRSAGMLQTLEGHSKSVSSVVFSLDGRTLASASRDNIVKLWDAGSGAVLQTLKGHSDSILAVAFSPDGKTLASASADNTVKLWDVGSGAVLQTLEGHLKYVSAVAFSPDGRTLASASGDSTVKVWDAGSGAVLQMLEGHSKYVRAVVFSPDGRTLASASGDSTVKVWDTGSGALQRTLMGHSSSVRAVAFSPDGKTLASASGAFLGNGNTLELWDAGSGALQQTLVGHSDTVNAVAFSPDGRMLASASLDKTVKLWDAGSGALLQTLDVGHILVTLSFSEDGTSLYTNRGSLLISLSPSYGLAVSESQLPCSIFVKYQWVHRHTERILWLPSEHRSSVTAVHGSIVGFGYISGRVTIVEFAP